jgi:thioredoxin 1
MTDPAPTVADLTDETFDAGVAEGTVLVDFWAAWCRPCHALTPVLDELALELPDVRVVKVDVAAFPAVGERFAVRSLPTLIVFRHGAPARTLYGVKTKRQLVRALGEVAGHRP